MRINYLIIGQGIAGTLLSYELLKAGHEVVVIDEAPPGGFSSLVAGAVINPAAGKHWAASPQQALFLPKAIAAYREIGAALNITVLKETSLLIFHEDAQQRQLFETQQSEAGSLLTTPLLNTAIKAPFCDAYGVGAISPVYLVDAALLLQAWRERLDTAGRLRPEQFDHSLLRVNKGNVVYKDLVAGKIIFCDGAAALDNPLLASLPFTRNRGEALLLSVPGLSHRYIYHHHIRLVPRSDGLFWCGSNYKWDFTDLFPDEVWRAETIKRLDNWLKAPFEIREHIVAERPTTAGQFPFVGIHPIYASVAVLNGLGTRGFSAGPYWAKELACLLQNPGHTITGYDQPRLQRLWQK